MGSLEVMVKSMLDLRQLETFGQKKHPHDRATQSTPGHLELTVGIDLRDRGNCLYVFTVL